MKQRKWVHLTYSCDLLERGHIPVIHGDGPFDCFELSNDDWEAFINLYDPPPKVYDRYPRVWVWV